MPEDKSWSWIDGAFKKIPIPYPYVSLIIFICCYLIYIFLSMLVESFPDYHDWDANIKRKILITSLLVAYGMAGVKYFTDNVRGVFKMMEPAPGCQKKIAALNVQLEDRFTKSKRFYIILFLVISPFYGIDLMRGEVRSYLLTEYRLTGSLSIDSITLDIFNNIAALLILYTMAMILWIIFNTRWALSDLESGSHGHIIEIDLFNVDDVGGLKPIRNLILKLVVYQFIAVSLAIINFVDPDKIMYHEILFLVLVFIITVCFFVSGWFVIQELLEGERGRNINSINELYRQQNHRVQDIIAGEEYWDNQEKLDRILTSMNFLKDERDRVKEASKHAYNFKSIFIFISSSLVPFITTYLLPVIIKEGSKVSEHITPKMEFLNDQVLPLINESLQIFY